MSSKFLFDLSVDLFNFCDTILSTHIQNWQGLDFAHKSAHLFWISISICLYIIFYNIILFIAIKCFPLNIFLTFIKSNISKIDIKNKFVYVKNYFK